MKKHTKTHIHSDSEKVRTTYNLEKREYIGKTALCDILATQTVVTQHMVLHDKVSSA